MQMQNIHSRRICMQNRHKQNSRRFMYDIKNIHLQFLVDTTRTSKKIKCKIDTYKILVDSCRTYKIYTSKIDTYKILVDSCRTYEIYTSKIGTYKILVDLCRTYEKDTYNFLWIHVGHTKSTHAK